jgi:hypothetical protein
MAGVGDRGFETVGVAVDSVLLGLQAASRKSKGNAWSRRRDRRISDSFLNNSIYSALW